MFSGFDQPQALEAGFAEATLLDQRITVYHGAGAAVDVIVSRIKDGGAEIARKALHYELRKGGDGWRIFSVQTGPTSADSLTQAWT